MLNLVDLPASARIRARAKMFVDVAMLEAEQSTIAGVRGGQKSRAKRDDITCNMLLALRVLLALSAGPTGATRPPCRPARLLGGHSRVRSARCGLRGPILGGCGPWEGAMRARWLGIAMR